MPRPSVLPLFPLTGQLLLPRALLPLQIFEPRYRAMVADVLGSHQSQDQLIGMIQPLLPMPEWTEENPLDDSDPEPPPALYQVGCAGRIDRWERLDDGRYLIVLQGISRFRWHREHDPISGGYRRVDVDWSEFEADEEEHGEVHSKDILAALKPYAERRGLGVDEESLNDLEPLRLLNALACALPFDPAEKQALLEAATVEARSDLLISLLAMDRFSPIDESSALAH